MDRQVPTIPRVNEQELYDALCGAASQNAALLQQSSVALKTMIDERFGTYDALQTIAAQKTVPLPVRQLALIQLKNTAIGHWRSRKLLSDELRTSIKQRTLAFLDEEDDMLADTNAIIVAKLCRSEVQGNWYVEMASELLRSVSQGLQAWVASNDPTQRAPIQLKRNLQMFYSIGKELVSMKMLGGVKATGKLILGSYETAINFYSALIPAITSSRPSNRTSDTITLSHILFKTLSCFSAWLFTKKDPEFEIFQQSLTRFYQVAAEHLPQLVNLRQTWLNDLGALTDGSIEAASVKWLSKHIRTFGKMLRRLQQLDKNRFVNLPNCTPLVLYYWNQVVLSTQAPVASVQDSPLAMYPVRFLVQAMVLFQNSLSAWAPFTKKGIPNAIVMPASDVQEAVKILVTQFIPLKMTDLQEWEQNPEQWVNEEDNENDQWEYELRPCGERLLITFANQYSQFVVPLLIDTFSSIASQQSTDLAFIQQKEALYCAVGRCAHQLMDKIPFSQWLQDTLLPEARQSNPIYRILKRRIAWVIGKWVAGQCASPQNVHVWETLVYLLQEQGQGTDAVVQVTAAMALGDCIDTLEFELSVFLPFLQTAVARLVQIEQEADDNTTKRRIAKAINILIERAGQHIVPIMEPIAQSVHQLWAEADDDWLFKASLLETTTKLVAAANSQSQPLHPLVVPLIQESLQPQAIMQLDADALDLWTTTLRATVPPLQTTPNVFTLLVPAISLLNENLDLLGKVTDITESYILLDSPAILQQHASALFVAFRTCFASAFAVNVKALLRSLQLLVQLAPSSLWGEPMHLSGLFPSLMKTLLDDEADSLVLTEHVHLFARMALVDVKMFTQLMNAASTSEPSSLPDPQGAAWEGLMDRWWNRFDAMSEPRHRKLTAMAMANLIASGNLVVLKRLTTEIFNLWLDVFGEVKEAINCSEDRSDSPINRYWDQDEIVDPSLTDTEGTPEYDRRKAVIVVDPVRTQQLTAFVSGRLREAEQNIPGGVQALQAIMASADPDVLRQIQAELSSA